MRLSRSRRPLAVAAVLALAVGCGSGSSSSSPDTLEPLAAVRAAASTTADAGSSRFALTSTTQVAGQTVEVTGEGLYDAASRTGSATMQLPGGAGTMEQRFLGDDLYLTVPGQPGFFRLSTKDLVGTSLENAAAPTGSLDALEAVSDDVRRTGEEDVRGEPTTRYEGTLDAQKALEQLGGAVRELADRGVDMQAVDDVPFAVWLDDEGRLRRFRSELELTATAEGETQAFTSTTLLELYDFGVDVQVEPPPADQVQDGAPLLELLRGGQG